MDDLTLNYADAYMACVAIAVIGLIPRLFPRMTHGESLLSWALSIPLLAIYLAGMHRVAGDDFANYFDDYYQLGGNRIPDPGYNVLTFLAKVLGLDFSTFIFLIGVFTLGVLYRTARIRNADPVVVLVIYLCHLAIGRDLSQIRIGLAVAICLLGQSQKQPLLKRIFYLVSMTVHITAVILIIVWEYSNWAAQLEKKKQLLWIYLPIGIVALFGASVLQIAALIDPRVQIYLSWDVERFGAPLSSYSSLWRTAGVLLVYISATRKFAHLRLQRFITMELLSIAILLGFSQYAIFASRLSNVAISMYPIGLGVVATCYQKNSFRYKTQASGFLLRFSLVFTLAVLLARPGSLETLSVVVPSAFQENDF